MYAFRSFVWICTAIAIVFSGYQAFNAWQEHKERAQRLSSDVMREKAKLDEILAFNEKLKALDADKSISHERVLALIIDIVNYSVEISATFTFNKAVSTFAGGNVAADIYVIRGNANELSTQPLVETFWLAKIMHEDFNDLPVVFSNITIQNNREFSLEVAILKTE